MRRSSIFRVFLSLVALAALIFVIYSLMADAPPDVIESTSPSTSNNESSSPKTAADDRTELSSESGEVEGDVDIVQAYIRARVAQSRDEPAAAGRAKELAAQIHALSPEEIPSRATKAELKKSVQSLELEASEGGVRYDPTRSAYVEVGVLTGDLRTIEEFEAFVAARWVFPAARSSPRHENYVEQLQADRLQTRRPFFALVDEDWALVEQMVAAIALQNDFGLTFSDEVDAFEQLVRDWGAGNRRTFVPGVSSLSKVSGQYFPEPVVSGVLALLSSLKQREPALRVARAVLNSGDDYWDSLRLHALDVLRAPSEDGAFTLDDLQWEHSYASTMLVALLLKNHIHTSDQLKALFQSMSKDLGAEMAAAYFAQGFRSAVHSSRVAWDRMTRMAAEGIVETDIETERDAMVKALRYAADAKYGSPWSNRKMGKQQQVSDTPLLAHLSEAQSKQLLSAIEADAGFGAQLNGGNSSVIVEMNIPLRQKADAILKDFSGSNRALIQRGRLLRVTADIISSVHSTRVVDESPQDYVRFVRTIVAVATPLSMDVRHLQFGDKVSALDILTEILSNDEAHDFSGAFGERYKNSLKLLSAIATSINEAELARCSQRLQDETNGKLKYCKDNLWLIE